MQVLPFLLLLLGIFPIHLKSTTIGLISNYVYYLNGSLDDVRIYNRALSAGRWRRLLLGISHRRHEAPSRSGLRWMSTVIWF